MLFDMLQAGLCFVIYFIMLRSRLFFLQIMCEFSPATPWSESS